MAIVPTPGTFVERAYAQGVYPLIRGLITTVTRLADLALFDLLLGGGLAGLLVWWTVGLVRAGRGFRLRAGAVLAGWTLVAGAVLYLVFLATWGLNYRREPLASRLTAVSSEVTQETLEGLTASAIAELNRLYGYTESSGWPQLADLPERLGPAFRQVQERLGAVRPAPGLSPRRSLLTPYFRRAGIDGMIDPFFLQVLVNDTVLPFERPFVTAHEWGHLAGYAHEAEANFVGWLTCLAGDEPMQYSGWIHLVPRLLAALPEDTQVRLGTLIDDGPRADFAAIRARLSRVVPVVQRNARRLNDRYLRANRVESGIASYGEVVRLAVGTELGRRQWTSSGS